MKSLKRSSLIFVAACAICFGIYSCKSNTTSSSTSSDSTATATTQDSAAMTPPADSAAKTKSNPDNDFVIDAARSNSQEIQMLEAGSEQGSNKKLKTDAKKMLADHQKLAKQMTDYAAKKNITLSSDTTMDMSAMNGDNEATFDTAWTQKMIAGHQQTIAKFEAAQNTVTDPELKGMITNTLPTLHTHLDMCQALLVSLKK
jgi:putative membrane protein